MLWLQWAAMLVLLCATQVACGSVAHDFVQAKTGIDVGPEVRLCSNGVLHDDTSCQPNGTGGTPWVRSENFDVFPIAAGNRTWQDIMNLAEARYLGAAFWRGRLQPACKGDRDVDMRAPGDSINVAVDSINLAAQLDEEINRRFVAEAVANLRKAGMPIDLAMEARFREELHRIVDQKIHVELVWFVATYTGGRYAMEKNPALHHCFEEVQSHANEGAGDAPRAVEFRIAAAAVTNTTLPCSSSPGWWSR